MKRLITIYLLFLACGITFTGYSQTLSGEFTNDGRSAPAYYTKIKWEISYTFIEKNGLFYIKFYNPKIKVPNYALYHDEFDKEYSLADLNLGVWPATKQLPAISIKVNISDGFNNYESSGGCNTNFTCGEGSYIIAKANLKKNVEVGNFRVTSVSYFHANLADEPAVAAILKNKRLSGNKSTNASSNTTTSSSTSTSETSTPSSESEDEKPNTPVYTPTYTKQDVTNQVINQAATLAGGLINDWNANYERKMALRDAANKAEIHAAYEVKTAKFEAVYMPLMDRAKRGDETARMILYFSSKALEREYLVPQRDQWFKEALANNNTDALLYKAFISILSLKEEDEYPFPYVEKIAEKGSVDAMMMLADWYDRSDKSGYKTGGNNAIKAMEWYEKAAANGSPNAMYHLGMIYKYGRSMETSGPLKNWYVKYDVVPDEKKAFDWFTKSLQPDAVQSIFSNGMSYDYFLSEFEPKTYRELAYFYRKGKVVPKDKAKADELDFFVLFAYKNKQKYNYIK